jgi:uncharacterized protein YgiM (DUF1202 family)
MKNLFMTLICIFIILFSQVSIAAESGTVLKSDELKKEPYSDAMSVAKLASGDKVTVLKKDGGWLNVKTPKGTGWVRMLSIRKGDVRNTSNLAANLKGLSSGRTGTGTVVATTGIRGLNEEELKAAKFDATQLTLAESFLTTRADAKKFADQAKLKSRNLDYLPVIQ